MVTKIARWPPYCCAIVIYCIFKTDFVFALYIIFLQKRVLVALEDAGVFTSGGLVKDKVCEYALKYCTLLFCIEDDLKDI